jgi:dTDP-4-amino-4,6-dideoxygalactose transaminase
MAYLAPAGTVMSLAEIGRGFVRGTFAGTRAEIDAELRRRSGLAHAWPIASGRAAMTLILQALRSVANDPDRDEVLVPAYTCYSVPASIARAGLRFRLVDVDPSTLGMDPRALEKTDMSRALAVVSSNLYGIPNDLPAIEKIARDRGIFMLDDSAQAFGARVGGRAVGAFGDAGLYSFDKGKVICTIQGGAVVCRNPRVAAAIGALIDALPSSTLAETFGNCLKLPIYAVCLRPALYGAIRSLPFLGLGRTMYEERYPIATLSAPQMGVAVELLRRLEGIAADRRARAARLHAALAGLPGIALPTVAPGAEPAWVRFPLRVTDPAARDAVVAAIDSAGIGATTSYPLALCDVPEVAARLRSQEPMPGARLLASQIVTLPTHGFCPAGYEQRIRATVTAGPAGPVRRLSGATP